MTETSTQQTRMDELVALCKRRGFIFQSSEIYGGLANAWDYGPLGAELKRNVRDLWWREYVHRRADMVGLDTAILMHPKVWEVSGHLDNFSDELVDCKRCKKRFRRDHLQGACPECGATEFTPPRAFQLMLKTHLGPVEDDKSVVFLRPETAQGIFVNFDHVVTTQRMKLPFGIAQIGKSFRNEITPGNFIFRTREFEQMEIEFFCRPEEAALWHERWIEERYRWYRSLGLREENLRQRAHGPDELAHYAAACTDIEYRFPFGWSELEGIANRTDFDLKRHSEVSGRDLRYQDPITGDKFFPYIIEPSGGVDRAVLAFLADAYAQEEVEGRPRVVLKLHPRLAPIKVAVLPLLKKNSDIVAMAQAIRDRLSRRWLVRYDDTAAIGKLYRRQDEIGTPFCVTVDVQSLEDQCVTVRDRDTMAQDRISADRLEDYLSQRLDID